MNDIQQRAARKLTLALNECGKAALTGGVFDGSFCLWPKSKDPRSSGESDADFFEEVEQYGEVLFTKSIELDGGAGSKPSSKGRTRKRFNARPSP